MIYAILYNGDFYDIPSFSVPIKMELDAVYYDRVMVGLSEYISDKISWIGLHETISFVFSHKNEFLEYDQITLMKIEQSL